MEFLFGLVLGAFLVLLFKPNSMKNLPVGERRIIFKAVCLLDKHVEFAKLEEAKGNISYSDSDIYKDFQKLEKEVDNYEI